MKSTLLILNPAAHGGKAGQLEETLRGLAAGEPGMEVRVSPVPGDAEKIARDAVSEGLSLIVAAGGDGTVNEVVNGIAAGMDASPGSRIMVRLGILPVGTMNVFATEMGIPLHSLQKAWDVALHGAVRHLDLPLCGTGGVSRRFVQLAGVGLDAEVVRRTSRESKKTLGPLSYLLSLAQIAGSKTPEIRIRTGEGRETTGSFVLLGNGRFYGGPFRLFREGSPTDGLLDVLVFRNQGAWDLLRYMHAILMGNHPSLEDVEYFQTSRLSLHSEGTVPYELDGEMAGYLPLEIALEERVLPVMTPIPPLREIS